MAMNMIMHVAPMLPFVEVLNTDKYNPEQIVVKIENVKYIFFDDK